MLWERKKLSVSLDCREVKNHEQRLKTANMTKETQFKDFESHLATTVKSVVSSEQRRDLSFAVNREATSTSNLPIMVLLELGNRVFSRSLCSATQIAS